MSKFGWLLCAASYLIVVESRTTWRHLERAAYAYSFEAYCSEFNKTYPAEEVPQRSLLFAKRLAEIQKHNTNTNSSWKMGVNQFTDMTLDEIGRFKGYKKHTGDAPQAPDLTVAVEQLPDSVDWRTKGVVTPVKDQGGCGSCWAFSSTEVIESHAAIASGKLEVLSPQQLVSCAPNPDKCGGTGGCQGSTQPVAFQYVETAGMTTDASYPYTARTGTCDPDKVKPVVSIKSHVVLPLNDYSSLLKAVATKGPIAISVAADWFGYEEGVYDGDCGSTIDHAVTLDGYGSENGKDYWLVRNSWGAGWGEGGYIKLFREPNPSCAIDKSPEDGTGCAGGPATQKVCGICGMLSESSYVVGASVITDEQRSPQTKLRGIQL